jgi:hypothetical protein
VTLTSSADEVLDEVRSDDDAESSAGAPTLSLLQVRVFEPFLQFHPATVYHFAWLLLLMTLQAAQRRERAQAT